MTKIKHLFTADWHLGKCLYKSKVIENNFYNAAFDLLEFAVSKRVNIIWNAGDLLDSIKPTEETLNVLKRIQEFLVKNEIRMNVISGNHDYPGNDRHWVSLFSDNTSFFGLHHFDVLPYVFAKENVRQALSEVENFDKWRKYQEGPFYGCNILPLHTPVKEFNGILGQSKQYLSCNDIVTSVIGSEARFTIVGDTHISSVINVDEKHIVISPGPIEMVYANESPDKYVYIVEFDSTTGQYGSLEQHLLPCSYIRIQSDLITSQAELDAFIETKIRNNPNYSFSDFFEKQVMLLVWCSNKDLSNEARGRLTEILNPSLTSRDNNVNPFTLHIVTKSPTQVKIGDVTTTQDVVDDNLVSVIKTFEDFSSQQISELQTSGKLSNKGAVLLKSLIHNTSADATVFDVAFKDYCNAAD